MFSMRRQRCRNTKLATKPAAATATLPATHQKYSSAGSVAKNSSKPSGAAEQRLYVDVLALFLAEHEQVARPEVQQARHDDVGERLDADVVAVDGLVVELAPVGDRVLEAGDAA